MNRWLIDLGVEITARDVKTSEVISIRCRFCEMGRDENPETNDSDRKRQRTTKIQYFQPPWRSDSMRRHVETQHCLKFKEYSKLSNEEKLVLFDKTILQSPFNSDTGGRAILLK